MAWRYRIDSILDEVPGVDGNGNPITVKLWESNNFNVTVTYFDNAQQKEFPDFVRNFQFARGITQADAVAKIKAAGNDVLATRRLVRDLQPEVGQTRVL